MKKILITMCGIALAISCNNADVDGEKLSPDSQKEKLEATAQKIMSECPAYDFQEFSDFGQFLTEHYFNNADYDYSAFEERYEQLYNEFYKSNTNGDILTLVLAQCTGEFTFGENAVTYTPSTDKLSLSVKDEQGRNYLVELKTEGEVKTIKNSDIDNLDITLKVPEKIGVLITRNGETMVSVDVTYNLRLTDNINPTADMAEITETVAIKNYVLRKYCSYDAASKLAKVNCTLTKGEKLIINHNASATVTLSGTTIEGANFVNVQNYSMNIDIMGDIQVKGTFLDYSKFQKVDYDASSQASTSEAAAQMNQLMSLKLYYDGKGTAQAHIEFECVESGLSNSPASDSSAGTSTIYYDYEPVIVFNDNSRYAVEDYFSEEMFGHLIDQFEDYAELFVALVDNII